MKRILTKILAVGCLFIGSYANSQSSLTIDASQNVTNFSFTNSKGDKVDGYTPSYSGGYAIGYRYTMENLGLYIPVKVGMRRAGATYIYDNANYNWSLQYLETRLGIGYNYSFGKFGTHISVTGYYGYMLKGTQTLNNQDFDIRNSGDINKNDYGIFISPGANFKANEFINVFLELNYMLGLANMETSGNQESKNQLYGATLGLAFTIKKTN